MAIPKKWIGFPPERRFWPKTERQPNGCLLWTGTIFKTGYGHFFVNKKHVNAHRFAWELANGPIPEGMQVLHRCDVRSCVEISHLYLGTQSDNMYDSWSRSRSRLTKLTLTQIRLILDSPLGSKRLAKIIGVSDSYIRTIRRGEVLQHHVKNFRHK